jgi:hypothetical protein
MDEQKRKTLVFYKRETQISQSSRVLKVHNPIQLTRLIWLNDHIHWRYTVCDCKFHVFGRKASHVAPQIIACSSGSTQHSVADASA